MTRYLLDTNIISNATKPAPSPSLFAWMAEQPDESLFISSLTIAEIRRGMLEKPPGANATHSKRGSPVRRGRRPSSPAASCLSTRRPPSSGRA